MCVKDAKMNTEQAQTNTQKLIVVLTLYAATTCVIKIETQLLFSYRVFRRIL